MNQIVSGLTTSTRTHEIGLQLEPSKTCSNVTCSSVLRPSFFANPFKVGIWLPCLSATRFPIVDTGVVL